MTCDRSDIHQLICQSSHQIFRWAFGVPGTIAGAGDVALTAEELAFHPGGMALVCHLSEPSRPALSNRIFYSDGSVLYLCCPIW